MRTPTFLTRPISASLFWGIIGGISLIAVTFFSNSGPIQFIPFPVILIAAIIFLKSSDTSDKAFFRMLLTGFLIVVIMLLILFFYIQLFENSFAIDFKSQFSRLGVIIAVGFVSSLIVSIIAKAVRR